MLPVGGLENPTRLDLVKGTRSGKLLDEQERFLRRAITVLLSTIDKGVMDVDYLDFWTP
jgi:hypothetical protein